MAKCTNCGADLPDGAKFCGGCGTAAPAPEKLFCGNCGTELAPGTKFCGSCGTAAPNATPGAAPAPAPAPAPVQAPQNATGFLKSPKAKMILKIVGVICVILAICFMHFYKDILAYLWENTESGDVRQSVEAIIKKGVGKAKLKYTIKYENKKYKVTICDTKGKAYLTIDFVCKYNESTGKPELSFADKSQQKKWEKLKEQVADYGDDPEYLQDILDATDALGVDDRYADEFSDL